MSSRADIQEIVIDTSFSTLGLSDALLRAVAEQGYTEPTPIQLQAIPPILAGRDLLGAAQTGTGKTAGFTLPMLQRLAAPRDEQPGGKPQVRALILTPTRELAAQVQDSVRTYGKHVKALRSITIFGGVNINPQIAELRRGVDILVATPGRLLDHVQQRTVDLSHVEILVLDEADRMLDMGFIHDMRRVVALLPKERQTLLFSATFSDDIRKLSGAFLRDPVTVEVARRNTPAELVSQVAHPVDRDRKRELLAHLVKSNNWQQVLVFCKTKHGANRLAQQLEKEGIDADAIHGNKSQPARTRALKRFKEGELQVLVATDIAARGLDIEALPHVVNFDLPNVSEDYVHRIGRTGRAGESGDAVSLVSHEDRPLLAAIERLMNRKVEQRVIPGFEPGAHAPRVSPDEDAREPRQPRNNESRAGRGGRGEARGPRRGGQPQGQRQGPPQAQGQARRHAPRDAQHLAPHDLAREAQREGNRDLQGPVPDHDIEIDDSIGNRMPTPGEQQRNAQPGAPGNRAGNRPGNRGGQPGRRAEGGAGRSGGGRSGGPGRSGGAGRPGGARSGSPGGPGRSGGAGRPGGPGRAGGPQGRRTGPGGGGARPGRPVDPMESERLRQLAEGKRMARSEPRETAAERAEREANAARKTTKRGPIPTVIAYLKRKVAI